MKRPGQTVDGGVKSIRALARGLDVLAALESSRGSSLQDLHASLGLPKATLLRLLKTLGEHGFVWRRIADGAYLPSMVRREIATASNTVDRLAEISSPFLARLSERVAWPSVMAAPRLNHVEIIETNSPLNRFDRLTLGPVGAKLSYIHTATGRAYLAFCDARERQAILDRLRPLDPAPGSEEAIHAVLDDIAARGYATRDPGVTWPGLSKIEVGRDGRKSVAVPILLDRQPIGSVNVTWPDGRTSVDRFVRDHLPTLREIAAAIAEAARRAGAVLPAA